MKQHRRHKPDRIQPGDDLSFLREDPHDTWPEAWRRLAPDVSAEQTADRIARESRSAAAPAKRQANLAAESRRHWRILTRHAPLAAMAALITLVPLTLYLLVFREQRSALLTIRGVSPSSSLIVSGQKTPVRDGASLFDGAALQSQADAVELDDGLGMHLRLDPSSLCEVRLTPDNTLHITLRNGTLHYRSNRHKAVALDTAVGHYFPVGTAFSLRTDGTSDRLAVTEGRVHLRTQKGEEVVPAGQARQVTRTGAIRTAKWNRSLDQAPARDRIVLKDGTVLEGTVRKTGRAYFIQTREGRRSVPIDQIREIRMDGERR